MKTENDNGGIRAAIDAGHEAAKLEPRIVRIGPKDCDEQIPLVLTGKGQQLHVPSDALKILESRQPGPRHRRGTAVLTELGSFVEHVNRFKSKASVVWADTAGVSLTAVFDYHPEGADVPAAWCAHRGCYTCPLSDEWKFWTKHNNCEHPQQEFAELLEDHLYDLTSGEGYPDPISVLEMARNLRIYSKGQFERHVDKVTGENSLVNTLEHTEKSTRIYPAFLLAVPVFEGGDKYKVEARVRFRLHGGVPTFAYSLYRRAEILRDAFSAVRQAVADDTGLPVFAGVPENRGESYE